MPRRHLPLAAAGALCVLLLAAAAVPGTDARPLPILPAAGVGGGSAGGVGGSAPPHRRLRRALLQDQQQQQQQDQQQQPAADDAVAAGYVMGAGANHGADASRRKEILFAGTSIDPVTHTVSAGGRASAVSGPAHIPHKP